jgi:TolA-binding protein
VELQIAAHAAMHADDPASARKHWLSLLRDFPSCPQVPHAYLAFAEHFFARGELASAKQAYAKVAQFPDAELRSFATYKLGWCELNLGNATAALGHFVAVVRAAGRAPSPSQQRLRDAALRDSVIAYAAAGNPTKARDFYRNVAGRDADATLARLAQHYRDRGDAAAATAVCADADACTTEVGQSTWGKP